VFTFGVTHLHQAAIRPWCVTKCSRESQAVEERGLAGQRRMLEATTSFSYDDRHTGRQRVVAGRTHVSADHWLVSAFRNCWRVSNVRDQKRGSLPI
jgi:uncharacterized protein affecting Mg2+/Co2+ transport